MMIESGKNLYFNPGCALAIYKPEMVERILDRLKERFPEVTLHQICCRHAPGLPAGSVIINVCAGCDRRFRTLYGGISTVSLWEVIDQLDRFPLPDYQGLKVSIHDACPVRDRPDVHRAVRSLLKKMNIQIEETELHGASSVCCGDSLYPACDEERIRAAMKKRADSMPCGDVVVYCVSCIKAMDIGGKRPRYLVDLLFQEETVPQGGTVAQWHEQLEDYILAH